MDYPRFLEHVASRAGLSSIADASVATEAVLHALGECLARENAERLADELPTEPASVVRSAVHAQNLDLGEWVSHVRFGAGPEVRTSVALELAAAVSMSLAEEIPEHLAASLRRDLPPSIAQLVRPPLEFTPPSPPRVAHRARTLAEGEPGGTRPLYASEPDRAQSESVARSDNPHGDTKLSSAEGLTQEREGESLATADASRKK
jgi:uncharacterized protein (DUF2267 family)